MESTLLSVRSGAARTEEQIECIESLSDLIDRNVQHCRDGPAVVTANGQDLAVEVLPLNLDHPQESGQHLERVPRELRELDQIDGHLATAGLLAGGIDGDRVLVTW